VNAGSVILAGQLKTGEYLYLEKAVEMGTLWRYGRITLAQVLYRGMRL